MASHFRYVTGILLVKKVIQMIRRGILFVVKSMLRGLLYLYFKKIRHGTRAIEQHRPLLFLANHQNALLDALLIAAFNQRETYFLVRSDVFKKPWVAGVLRYFGLRPIYRIRDGKHLVSQNDPIFNFFAEMLVQGHCVLIFPEGNHSLRRTVRPLRKGFIEIVDRAFALNPTLNLGLVTVGLSYEQAKCFRDRVHIQYAAALDAAPLFVSNLKKKERDSMLLHLIHLRLSTCTVHIPSDRYSPIEEQLIHEGMNFLEVDDVNGRITQIIDQGIVIHPSEPEASPCRRSTLERLCYTLGWPLVLIWRTQIRSRIKEEEFISTFRFAYFTGIVLMASLLLAISLICLL